MLFKKIFQDGEKHWNAVYLTNANDGCLASGKEVSEESNPRPVCFEHPAGVAEVVGSISIPTWHSEIFSAVPWTVRCQATIIYSFHPRVNTSGTSSGEPSTSFPGLCLPRRGWAPGTILGGKKPWERRTWLSTAHSTSHFSWHLTWTNHMPFQVRLK